MRWLLIGLVLSTCAVGVSPAQVAPRSAPVLQSLDSSVINGYLVVVGKIESCKDDWVTIAVEETIKGEAQPKIESRLNNGDGWRGRDWQAQGARLLISFQRDRTAIIDLSSKDISVFRANLSVVKNANQVLDAARQIAKDNRGRYGIAEFAMTVAASVLTGTPQDPNRNWWAGEPTVQVPVDQNLAAWAEKAVSSVTPRDRVNAARALTNFRTASNEFLLRKLLKDPFQESFEWSAGLRIRRRINFPVRAAAFQVLKMDWQISVDQPVTTIPPPDQDWDVSLDLGGKDFGAERSMDLDTSRTLIDLTLVGSKLNETVWDQVLGLEELENLYLGGSNVTDKDLAHLTALKSLRCLDVSNSRVTSQALSAFKDHPNIKVVYLDAGIPDAALLKLKGELPRIKLIRDPVAILNPFLLKRIDINPSRTRSLFQPVGIFYRAAVGMRSSILLVPTKDLAAIEDRFKSKLPSLGWVARGNGWDGPIPPVAKELQSSLRDRIEVDSRNWFNVETPPGYSRIFVLQTFFPH